MSHRIARRGLLAGGRRGRLGRLGRDEDDGVDDDVAPGALVGDEHVAGAVPPARRRYAMIVMSAAFAILGFTLASILAHMVPMLGTLD